MLRFSQPRSLEQSLFETYRHLQSKLEALLGFPVKIDRLKPPLPRRSAIRTEAGLELALPGAKNRDYPFVLKIEGDWASDPVARQLAGRFVGLCTSIAAEAKQAWDLKARLIREEEFLCDALLTSITHAGNQKYTVLEFLSVAKTALMFRYEGEPTELGVLVTWNWHDLAPKLSALGCRLLDFKSSFDLRARLQSEKAARLLANGSGAYFIAHPRGTIGHLAIMPSALDVPPNAEWELVPSRYHSVAAILHGRDIALATTKHGEIYWFRKSSVFKWVNPAWHRVSGPPLSKLLGNYLPECAAAALSALVVKLSEQRTGALLTLAADPADLLRAGGPGIAVRFDQNPIADLSSTPLDMLLRLATIDGAMVVGGDGGVYNAGVILNVPSTQEQAGEGARSAAASFASKFGLAIKVSHDGPITVFAKGVKIRQAA